MVDRTGSVPTTDETWSEEKWDDGLENVPLGDLVDRSAAPNVVRVGRRGRSWRRRVGLTAVALTVLTVVYYTVSLAQVVGAGRSQVTEPVDAIVVLGAAQYDGRPSPQLAARLDHAVELWQQGLAPTIMVTGGKLPGDRFTEAEASRGYLVERGVPEVSILMEDAGRTTYESLESAAPILLDAGLVDVALVSDSFHLKRADLIADRFGLDARPSAAPDSVVTGWTSVRRHLVEAGGVAIGRIIGFDRLSDIAG